MASYCEFSLGSGAVVIAAQVDEAKTADAKKVLKEAAAAVRKVESATPGFYVASRMSGTNPIDAEMTGDFRRY
ncbi:hypothetical protein ACFLWX_02945 [Chloroflexota bacterium]